MRSDCDFFTMFDVRKYRAIKVNTPLSAQIARVQRQFDLEIFNKTRIIIIESNVILTTRYLMNSVVW